MSADCRERGVFNRIPATYCRSCGKKISSEDGSWKVKDTNLVDLLGQKPVSIELSSNASDQVTVLSEFCGHFLVGIGDKTNTSISLLSPFAPAKHIRIAEVKGFVFHVHVVDIVTAILVSDRCVARVSSNGTIMETDSFSTDILYEPQDDYKIITPPMVVGTGLLIQVESHQENEKILYLPFINGGKIRELCSGHGSGCSRFFQMDNSQTACFINTPSGTTKLFTFSASNQSELLKEYDFQVDKKVTSLVWSIKRSRVVVRSKDRKLKAINYKTLDARNFTDIPLSLPRLYYDAYRELIHVFEKSSYRIISFQGREKINAEPYPIEIGSTNPVYTPIHNSNSILSMINNNEQYYLKAVSQPWDFRLGDKLHSKRIPIDIEPETVKTAISFGHLGVARKTKSGKISISIYGS